jgi:hypothetical protein
MDIASSLRDTVLVLSIRNVCDVIEGSCVVLERRLEHLSSTEPYPGYSLY